MENLSCWTLFLFFFWEIYFFFWGSGNHEVAEANGYGKALVLWTFSPMGSLKRPWESSDLKSFQTDVLQGRPHCSPPSNTTNMCQSLHSVHWHHYGTTDDTIKGCLLLVVRFQTFSISQGSGWVTWLGLWRNNQCSKMTHGSRPAVRRSRAQQLPQGWRARAQQNRVFWHAAPHGQASALQGLCWVVTPLFFWACLLMLRGRL